MSNDFGFYPSGPGGIPVGAPSQYAGASLNPPGRAQMGGTGPQLPPFMRTNIWPPQLLLSTNSQVAHATRYYSAGIIDQPLNAQQTLVIQFDIPCIIYAMAAASNSTAAPFATQDPGSGLDTFSVALEHTNGDRLTTQATLGSTVFGTALQPNLIGGNGWVFDRGSGLVIQVTPLQAATQRIDFTFYAIEERGPRNLTR